MFAGFSSYLRINRRQQERRNNWKRLLFWITNKLSTIFFFSREANKGSSAAEKSKFNFEKNIQTCPAGAIEFRNQSSHIITSPAFRALRTEKREDILSIFGEKKVYCQNWCAGVAGDRNVFARKSFRGRKVVELNFYTCWK